MAQPVVIQAFRRLVIDTVTGIVGFPMWWYGRGLISWVQFCWRMFGDYRAWLGVGLWVRNLFVPMYGSYDFVGRIVSFFMRVVMILLRSTALILLAAVFLLLIAAYVFAPLWIVVSIAL